MRLLLRVRFTRIEFVTISDPSQPIFGYIIKSYQIVVTGYSMDRPNADLMQTLEEVLGSPYKIWLASQSLGVRTSATSIGVFNSSDMMCNSNPTRIFNFEQSVSSGF